MLTTIAKIKWTVSCWRVEGWGCIELYYLNLAVSPLTDWSWGRVLTRLKEGYKKGWKGFLGGFRQGKTPKPFGSRWENRFTPAKGSKWADEEGLHLLWKLQLFCPPATDQRYGLKKTRWCQRLWSCSSSLCLSSMNTAAGLVHSWGCTRGGSFWWERPSGKKLPLKAGWQLLRENCTSHVKEGLRSADFAGFLHNNHIRRFFTDALCPHELSVESLLGWLAAVAFFLHFSLWEGGSSVSRVCLAKVFG